MVASRLSVVLAAVAIGVSACSGGGVLSRSAVEVADPVTELRAAWADAAIDQYTIAVTEADRTKVQCTWITEVDGADTDSRWSADGDKECGEWTVTVPRLLDRIAQHARDFATERSRYTIESEPNGVPSRAGQFRGTTSDDDFYVTVEFVDETASDSWSTRLELADARARWRLAGIRSYQIRLWERVNYWSRGCSWTSIVENGAIVSERAGERGGESCMTAGITVETLHDRVARMARDIESFPAEEFGDHTLDVSYDEIGVPTNITFDLANGSDEETDQQITFTPLP